MSTQPNPTVLAWLDKLEHSALIRQQMASFGTHHSFTIIREIIANQINILADHVLGSGGGLGSKSNELRRVIELYTTLTKPYNLAPDIAHEDLRGLDSIMAVEFCKLDVEEVARDLKFYTLLRKNMTEGSQGSRNLEYAINRGLNRVKTEMIAINKVRSCLYNKRKGSG